MTTPKSEPDLSKASLKFFLTTLSTVIFTLLIAAIITWVNGSYTFWALIPVLAGFPISLFLNLRIAKKSILRPQPQPEGEQDETIS